MDEIGLEKARRVLGEIVERARLKNEPTHITRLGKPAAVVVGAEWYAWAAGFIERSIMRGVDDFLARPDTSTPKEQDRG